jgi:flagellar basal-body rod protein FlgG
MPGGQMGYTRAGNFTLSSTGQVVTSQGYVVQPPITIPAGATAITIGTDGTVSAIPTGSSAPTTLGQIQLASFTNPAGMQASSDNFLMETAASGPVQMGAPGQNGTGSLTQGMLETSNVNITNELVDMIECQRAYEINSKMISSVDEMLKNANETL